MNINFNFNIDLSSFVDPTITNISQFKRAYSTIIFSEQLSLQFTMIPAILLKYTSSTGEKYNGFDDNSINNLLLGIGSSNCNTSQEKK